MPSGQAKGPPASVPHYPTSSTIPHNPIASAISTYIPNPTCPVIPADAHPRHSRESMSSRKRGRESSHVGRASLRSGGCRVAPYQTTPTPPRTLTSSPPARATPALTKTRLWTRALMPMARACSLL